MESCRRTEPGRSRDRGTIFCSAIRWGTGGLEVDRLMLSAGPERRIAVNGKLPPDRAGTLEGSGDNFLLGDPVGDGWARGRPADAERWTGSADRRQWKAAAGPSRDARGIGGQFPARRSGGGRVGSRSTG